MKIITLKIDKFNGGMSDDVREQANGVFTITRNFDIFTNERRLSPYRDTIANDTITGTSSDMTSFDAHNFLYDPNLGLASLSELDPSLTGRFRMLYKSDPVGNGTNWAILASSSQTTIGTALFDVFLPFKDYFWSIK